MKCKYGIWTSAKTPRPRPAYLKYALLVLALLAAYALGRMTRPRGEYDRGFDAGMREAGVDWSEWK